ncbi:MAG: zinc-binding dehydrogenase [Actinomycetota bacterium]|nr:zinc-binding dehydrogenase [Actinomycetota bacterium]
MLAVRWLGVDKPLEVTDIAVPEPGPGEVRVRVAACGVCASDLHVFDGSLPSRAQPPVTPGHESAGVVSALGDGVTAWRLEDRVAIYAGKGCGVCKACVEGRPVEECWLPLTMGVDYDGAWAEEVVVPASALVRLPENVPFEVGAILADCVATPFAAVTETAALKTGERIAIFGVGGLGTHAVQIARMAGASFVAAVDARPGALERAKLLGADLAVEPEGAVAAIRDATGGEGVDVACDFVGANNVLKAAVASLAKNGRAIVVGVSGERISLGPSILFAVFGTKLLGHYGYRRSHLETLVDLVSSGRLDISGSISARLPLEQAEEAVRMLRTKENDPVRILLVHGVSSPV